MYRLRCFGTMALEDGGGAELSLRSRKHWALLVYLLAHRGRAFPRERLARLFWDSEPRLARHSLSQALYDIRTTLPGVAFDSSTSQVGAGAEAIAYDGEVFEEAVRADELDRAVRLYGGRFAPDVEDAGNSDFTRWLESERHRYRRLAEMALYRHVRESQDRAEWGEMCVSALRLLDMNPLNEDAHRALMRGLWLQGDRAAAIGHFEDVEDFLSRELPGGIGQETLDLLERIRTNRPAAASGTEAGRVRPEMVGREEEFSVLRGRLDELREDGRGGLIRIHGEAGMGKTRLLEEFRSLVELDGARLLESRCYAAGSDVPYGPVVDALGGLAEEISAAGGDGELSYHQLGHLFPGAFERPDRSRDAFAEPDAGRRRLYEEVADLLRRAFDDGPIVWLVEDVHWMDPSSASLMHYLARRLDDSPVLVIATSRTHEETDGPVRDLLEDDARTLPRVEDVELEPLEHEETGNLVASVHEADPDPDAVDRIHVLAGGNPFYALELLRASGALEGRNARDALDNGSKGLITESLRTLLERRLRGLETEAVRIMEAVAVAGRHAEPRLVREVTDLPAHRVAELAGGLYSRGLLRDADGHLAFHHDITRDFVYGRLGDLQRSALHLSVGELLEGRDPDTDPATLARHFRRGDEPARAYTYALKAARDAERRHAHDEAIRMAEMALEMSERDKERANALWVLGKAEYSSMKLVNAREHFSELEDYTASKQSHYDVEEVYFYLARIALELSQWEEAEKWLGRADSVLLNEMDLEKKLICLHLELKMWLKSARHKDARRIREKIKQLAQSEGIISTTSVAGALVTISLAAYDLYYRSAGEGLDRLEDISDLDSLPYSLKLTLLQLKGSVQQRSAEFEKARATHRQALAVAADYNDLIGRLAAVNNLMCECLERGRPEQGLHYYESIQDLVKILPSSCEAQINLEMNLAETLFSLESYQEAAEKYRELAQWMSNSTKGDSDWAPTIHSGLGLSLLAIGEYRRAMHIYKQMSDHDWTVPGAIPAADLVGWFKGFMYWVTDAEQAHQFMMQWADDRSAYQTVAARRIRWVATLLSQATKSGAGSDNIESLYRSDVARPLRQVDNGWFLRFSHRWLRTTLNSQVTSQLRTTPSIN